MESNIIEIDGPIRAHQIAREEDLVDWIGREIFQLFGFKVMGGGIKRQYQFGGRNGGICVVQSNVEGIILVVIAGENRPIGLDMYIYIDR